MERSLKNVLVIVLDRLGAGFLGPYGNTWIETPALNQFAAQALLIENAIIDSSDLTLLYRSLWNGTHALSRQPILPERNLAQLATGAGLKTVLVTDEELLLSHPSCHFQERFSLLEPEPTEPAAGVEETCLARLCVAAADQLSQRPTPWLMWVHARAMEGTWDAPLELRERYREEGDPPPYDDVVPPALLLAPDHDPDELLRYLHAYAAEVSVADTCIGILLDALDEQPQSAETLVVLAGARGYPLGERGWVGGGPEAFGEVVQVPLLVRVPDRASRGIRLQTLAQPASIYATIADWLGLPVPQDLCWRQSLLQLAAGESPTAAPCAIAIGPDERSIRTPAWFLHLDRDHSPALFAKPDDRWEVNEVANRCGSIAQQLADILARFEQLASLGQLASFPEIPPELIERAD